MTKGITVKELLALCQRQVKKGNGNKYIQISCDDEGNEFHTLFFGFTDEKHTIEFYERSHSFHDHVNTDEIILLG